jgi:cytochrome c peroxidase
MNKKNNCLFIVITALFIASCSKESNYEPVTEDTSILNLPNTIYNYTDIAFPNHLTTNALLGPPQNAAIDNDNTPTTNQTTNDGATLGRVLFYDKNLSANGTIACASCHVQSEGFSDSRVLSVGFDGGTTRRHSMSLINARWFARGTFFWDERAASLEEQVLEPFQDPVEMGMTLNEVVSAVQNQAFYPELFENAFGSNEINSDKISKALAQFIRSIVSISSKYDVGRAQVTSPTIDFPNFSTSENNGKNLFIQTTALGGLGCIGCHATEAFINLDIGPLNNGLDLVTDADNGAFETFPLINRFLGAFKVPSLKNIELTAPYMHDGRFATLEEVVEHYNSGIQFHENLHKGLTLDDLGLEPLRLNLTEQEKTDLVNFLKTLTDNEIITNPKFSDPFN